MSRLMISFSDQIRQAISDSGVTRYRIAKESNVHLAALMRFMEGKSLTLTSVDRLAHVLGLRVVVDRPAAASDQRDTRKAGSEAPSSRSGARPRRSGEPDPGEGRRSARGGER
jgi:hypothetical protein